MYIGKYWPDQSTLRVLCEEKSRSARSDDRTTMSKHAPKKVLFLDHTAKMGGGEYALLHLSQRLDRSRFEPIVLLFSDGPLREKLVDAGVETYVYPLSSRVVSTRKDTLGAASVLQLRNVLQIIGYCWRLSRFMKKLNIDIVHTNSLKADLIGGVSARLAAVPVIWHIRDRIENDYLPSPVVKVFRWLCRVLPHQLIANSHATLETLQLSGTRTNSTAHVVHDGVVPIDFSAEAQPQATPLIGIIGRVTRWKGQHIFVQAAAQVRQEFPQARFQIIGSSLFGEEDYAAELAALIKELKQEDCIELTGFVTDVNQYLQKLDVLVHASITSEPFGLVVVEGMMAAKPVIATKGGGVLEIVRDGETGLLVPMGDADALASALKYLLNNPDAAQAMGQAGKKRVQENFTIDLTVQRVQDVYEQFQPA
jgi:glycosyltransferase involved in cell wall biosynthesis